MIFFTSPVSPVADRQGRGSLSPMKSERFHKQESTNYLIHLSTLLVFRPYGEILPRLGEISPMVKQDLTMPVVLHSPYKCEYKNAKGSMGLRNLACQPRVWQVRFSSYKQAPRSC